MQPRKLIKANDEELFEVEKIISHRIHHFQLEFKVKWLNYNNRYNKWVKEHDLNCPELLCNYFCQYIKKKNKKNLIV